MTTHSPCDDRVLGAYLDRELNDGDTKQIEAHLFTCCDCRDHYRQLRTLKRDLMVSTDGVALPRQLELKLFAQADRFISLSNTDANFFERRQLLTALAVALAAIVGMGLFAPRQGHGPIVLSSQVYPVADLSDFGHSLLAAHMGGDDLFDIADNDEMKELVTLQTHVPQNGVMGTPWVERGAEIDGEWVHMAYYERYSVQIGLFVLSRARADHLLGRTLQQVEADACSIADGHRCYSGAFGMSLCIEAADPVVRVWTAHMPKNSLLSMVYSD